jgi:predicted regulator of Ras-like GTPase activity (Roadblock/LC7/MglB family)
MPFKEVLNQLLQDVPGSLGVVIVDWEGEAVDQATRIGEYDIKILGAHHGIILTLLRDALARMGSAYPEEVVIRTQQGTTLIQPLTEDYLLILQLQHGALVARAAQKLRCCAEQLYDDIAP